MFKNKGSGFCALRTVPRKRNNFGKIHVPMGTTFRKGGRRTI